MGATYKIGRRFRKLKYICVVANCLVVGVFYFVYRYLLEGAFPEFAKIPLALIFCALMAAAARITIWAADRYASAISYTVRGWPAIPGQGPGTALSLEGFYRGAAAGSLFSGRVPGGISGRRRKNGAQPACGRDL